MTELTHHYIDALVYCANIHADQVRKGSLTPYLAHLMSVSAMVIEDGGDENEAIAALLHDALEDQPDKTSPEELRTRFGDHVLQLVVSCSDTPPDYSGGTKPPWKERKERYLKHLREGAGGALRIALADKLDNARGLAAAYQRKGEEIWEIFNAGKRDQLWYFRSLVDAFNQGGAEGVMFDQFKKVVSEIERLADEKSIP